MVKLKISPDHFEYIRKAIEECAKKNGGMEYLIERYRNGDYPRSEKTNDINMRFRWDLFNAAVPSNWICDNLYPYMNDTHVDSALRQIVPDVK